MFTNVTGREALDRTRETLKTHIPAAAVTFTTMALTLAVVVMWLGPHMGDGWVGTLVAVVVGLGLDGGWLATLAYERRLARQGDHNRVVTAVGWGFGVLATAVLVGHALTEEDLWAWLAVAWLPLAAKALWLVHGLWERTALTPVALDRIARIQQEARDEAAIQRAQLRAESVTEVTRLDAVTGAGARVAVAQVDAAKRLSEAWAGLEKVHKKGAAVPALTAVAAPEAPLSWALPMWGPSEPVPAVTVQLDRVDQAVDQMDQADQNPVHEESEETVEEQPSETAEAVVDHEEGSPVHAADLQVVHSGPIVDRAVVRPLDPSDQVALLVDRIRSGERVTKRSAATLLGTSETTAQRRLTEAKAVAHDWTGQYL